MWAVLMFIGLIIGFYMLLDSVCGFNNLSLLLKAHRVQVLLGLGLLFNKYQCNAFQFNRGVKSKRER